MISEGSESSFIFLPNQLRLFIRRRNCLEDLKQGTARHSDIGWTLQITQKFCFAESNSICVWKGKATKLCKRIFVLAVLFLLLENFFLGLVKSIGSALERATSVQEISQCMGTCMHTHTQRNISPPAIPVLHWSRTAPWALCHGRPDDLVKGQRGLWGAQQGSNQHQHYSLMTSAALQSPPPKSSDQGLKPVQQGDRPINICISQV